MLQHHQPRTKNGARLQLAVHSGCFAAEVRVSAEKAEVRGLSALAPAGVYASLEDALVAVVQLRASWMNGCGTAVATEGM